LVGLVGGGIVVASIAAGLGSFALAWYLTRHRGRPGATWFMGSLAAQGVWALAYGVGLLTFDPFWRGYAEALAWTGMNTVGPLFLGFGLAYTGRSEVLRNKWAAILFLSPLVTVVLALTHPTHSLLWAGFQIVPVFDLSTVTYAIQPLGYATVITSLSMAGVGVLLLVETVLSYGPIYRRESVAVVLSPLPATVPLLVWLGGLGPWPALNLTPALLLSHVAFDAYAFVGTRMFETNPVTQRAAEQTALAGLDDPLLVVDPDERVVNCNDRASALFETVPADLPISLAELTGASLATLREDGELRTNSAVYAVSYTPLSDPREMPVGGIVVLYDITTERQQRQQLSVLNRVLRHNLRNEMTVVGGYAESIASATADSETAAAADEIGAASDRLLSIAGNIRDSERIQDGSVRQLPVEIDSFIDDLAAEIADTHPEADLSIETATDRAVAADPEILSLALENLVENAIVHADTASQAATLRIVDAAAIDSGASGNVDVVDADSERISFEVVDDNAPIPEMERASLTAETEGPLQHGSGIGLWTVNRCVEALNGDLEFAYDDGNVVRITLPAASGAVAGSDPATTDHHT